MATLINGQSFASGDDPHSLTLTDDEILILFEFFERLEENDELKFQHPAEWAALGHLTAQFESTLWQLFASNWEQLLADARARRARGFEGSIPGLGYVRAEDDGSLTPLPDPDAETR